MRQTYDIAFLGGGPAGYQGAIRAAQLGARVAVVEERSVGGVCLNQGCIPSKTVRASAELARSMRRAAEYGFRPVEVVPDMAAVMARKERVVAGLRRSIERLFQAHRIDLVEGRGRLVAPNKMEVEKDGQARLIETERLVVATGSRPATLPSLPRGPGLLLADDILDTAHSPSHLLVVGGGVVGVEMAAIFRELGSQVTLVEAQRRLLPAEDAEMSDCLRGVFQRRKVKTIFGAEIKSASREGDKYNVQLTNGTDLSPDAILLAVGRQFNTEGIGLEKAGVALEEGHIKTNERLQTSVPGVYAAGDVVGGWLLAHVAFAEGICAAENAFGLESRMDYRVVPRVVASLPEYAAVGLSEEEAQATSPIKVARFPFKSLGMGQAMGELEGLAKIISHGRTDQILGAHIIGPHAGDLVCEIALAMKAEVPSLTIAQTIHSHPSLGEAVQEVAHALHGHAIHMLQGETAS